MMKTKLSWPERFALLEHYKPSDEQACAAFGLTQDELMTARGLEQAGMFKASKTLDVTKYASVFSADGEVVAGTTPDLTVSRGKSTTTTHVRPESASRKPKVPQKRGRKGDKISTALLAVPTTMVPVETFMAQHNVSLAVLRQSKRFLAKMDPETVQAIGTINVRQDKTTKQLMIWRTPNPSTTV